MCKTSRIVGLMVSLCMWNSSSQNLLMDLISSNIRCALIHCHRPDLLDYDMLDKGDRHGNTRLAFQVAAEHLNIPVSAIAQSASDFIDFHCKATPGSRRSL